MIKLCRLYLAVMLVFLIAVATGQNLKEISTGELKEHVYFLASDTLKGRKPGTPESTIAATYIRDEFRNAGLELIGDDGFQSFDVIMSVEPGNYNKLSLAGMERTMNEDYKPMSFSGNGKLEAEVVFAGFGFEFETDTMAWDDYAQLDVEGKWVMLLRGDPEPDNDESLFITYGNDRDKVLTARDHKAGGVLLVNGPQFGAEDQLVETGINRVTADAGLPVINITASLANEILSQQMVTIAMLEDSIITQRKPVTVETSNVISAKTDMIRVMSSTLNVVGIVPGNDPVLRDEFVVVGAHYDHLGLGGMGSGSRMPDTIAVHNGADDNASGTAGIIELAEKLADKELYRKRSVLVMAFGAEEMGLLGSQFFVANPEIDLKEVIAMVNFDMIGRLKPDEKSVMVAGTGTAMEFETMLKGYEQESALSFNHSPEGYGASDHASFYASGIPVMFFSTGAHPDYHTPYDDAEKINYAGQKEILDYAFDIILDLANREESLTYQEAGPKKQARYGRGLKVKLGIMPDFTSNENNGLGVGGVTAGGPASKAGMLKGDRIVAIEGQPVTNIYDYMNRLKKLKPGQTISVDVVRDDEPVVLVVVL